QHAEGLGVEPLDGAEAEEHEQREQADRSAGLLEVAVPVLDRTVGLARGRFRVRHGFDVGLGGDRRAVVGDRHERASTKSGSDSASAAATSTASATSASSPPNAASSAMGAC